jgi:hypothetical protein
MVPSIPAHPWPLGCTWPARSTGFGSLAVLVVVFVALLLLPQSLGRVDDGTLRVRVLYLGDASFPPNQLVLQWVMAEPRFSLTIVPCDTYFISLPVAMRMTRLYLPRSYAGLNATQDVVVLHNIEPAIIPGKVLASIQRALEEDAFGLGLISYMFWGAGAGTNAVEVWMTLALYDAFPAEIDTSRDIPAAMGRTYWRVVRRDPILNLPDLEKQPMQVFGNHGGDIWPRPGSVIHAVWRGRGTPVLVTGDYGTGRTLQLGHGWHNPPDHVFQNYRYMPDLHYNQLYFLADVPPPEDIELAHRTRELFIDVRVRKSVTIATMDFVDRFGARLDEVEEELSELDPMVREAERSYLSGDLQAAGEVLEEVMESYPAIEESLTRLKERTMTWIYVSEWVVIVSTAMVCGTLVWGLMVRRRLYRAVATTRLGQKMGE